LNDLQRLPATPVRPTETGCLAKLADYSRRVSSPGSIASKRNRKGSASNQRGTDRLGGRRFKTLERRPPSYRSIWHAQSFFLTGEPLINFSEIKNSNSKPAICASRSMVPGQVGAVLRDLFSRYLGEPFGSEKVSQNSRGGEGYVMTALAERTK
jgi:hypothetical protein